MLKFTWKTPYNELTNSFKLILLAFLIATSIYLAETAKIYSVVRPRPGSQLGSVLRRYRLVKLEKVNYLASAAEYSQASQTSSSGVHMKIQLRTKIYGITLRKADRLFTEDAQIIIHNRSGPEQVYAAKNFDLPVLVEGRVVSCPNSSVFGLLNNGIFNGNIRLRDRNYAVEPAEYYFVGTDPSDVIVYDQNDLSIPLTLLASNVESCKSQASPLRKTAAIPADRKVLTFDPQREREWMGRVCKMAVVGDHYFYDFHYNNVRKAIADMEYHIAAADHIFRETDFNNDGRPDNVRIRVAGVHVYRHPSQYGFNSPGLNATEYLRLFSMYDFHRYCAAMAFTFQKVPGGTLGYAYRGGKKFFGGICTPRKVVGRVARSMNVGMVSLLAPWGMLYRVQSTVVVAHEIGHMFGSSHDDHAEGGVCHSKSKDKHFVMSAKANPGISRNNRMFSPCSKRSIMENMIIHGKCLICRGRECLVGGGTGVQLFTKSQKAAVLVTSGLLRWFIRILQHC